jgi:hypothetical protein
MTSGFPDMMYDHMMAQTRLESQTADGITWARYATPSASIPGDAEALSRVTFEEFVSPVPLHSALHRVRLMQRSVVVVGRSHRLAVDDNRAELRTLETEYGGAVVRADVRKTIGDVGTAFVMAGLDANLLVMQASSGTDSDQ